MTNFPYTEIVLVPRIVDNGEWRPGCAINRHTGDKVEVIQARWELEKTCENKDAANLIMRANAFHYLRTTLGLDDSDIDEVKVTYR